MFGRVKAFFMWETKVLIGGKIVINSVENEWNFFYEDKYHLIQGVSKMIRQTSRVSYPHQNMEKSSCQHISTNT
jgi:hypothetical protein